MEIQKNGLRTLDGQVLHVWAKKLSPKELMNTEWLTKLADETPNEKLIQYNQAISVIAKMIEAEESAADHVAEKEINGQSLFLHLIKEKVYALIHMSEKIAKENSTGGLQEVPAN